MHIYIFENKLPSEYFDSLSWLLDSFFSSTYRTGLLFTLLVLIVSIVRLHPHTLIKYCEKKRFA